MSTSCGWDTITQTISVKETPIIDFEIPEVICAYDSTTKILAHNIQNQHQFTWSIGNAAPNSDVKYPVLYFNQSGKQQITLVVKDLFNLCSTTLTKNIEVKPQPQAVFIVVRPRS